MVSRRWSTRCALCTLFTTLFALAAEGQSTLVADCDRDRSRLARSIVNQYLLPHMHWSSYKLPEECPLHPVNDMFAAIEGAKEQVKAHHWRCGFCGAVSGSEELLDQHIHHKHGEAAHEGGDQCLAHMCDLLHCDYIHEQILKLEGVKSSDPYTRHAPCDPQKELQLRNECSKVADICFPMEAGHRAPEMWTYLVEHICSAHICDEELKTKYLMAVVDSRPHIKWGYSIFAGFVTFMLLGFYLIFWMYMRIFVGTISADEFVSLRPKRRGWAWPFGKRKPKEF